LDGLSRVPAQIDRCDRISRAMTRVRQIDDSAMTAPDCCFQATV